MTGSKEYRQMKIGLAQVKPKKSDLQSNIAKIRKVIAKFSEETDIIVFSEANLTGYFLEGGVTEASLSVGELVEMLGPPPKNSPDVVLGFYENDRDGPFNSVSYLEASSNQFKVKHVHRKLFLPTYGVFDEARFVRPGTDVAAFSTRHGRIGLLICEDMWHSLPSTILALQGAELIIGVSASPARDFLKDSDGLPGNLKRWDTLVPSIALEHGIFVAVSQLVGSEGGKIFPGGSIISSPEGSIIARAPLMEEGVTLATLSNASIARARNKTPLLSDLERALPDLQRCLLETRKMGSGKSFPVNPVPGEMLESVDIRPKERFDTNFETENIFGLDLELVEKVLIEFIRDEVIRNRGFEKAVIGISGGVDSSVTLYLAVAALGAENVVGIKMPYSTSSKESSDHADLVLNATGTQGNTVDISKSVNAYVEQFEKEITPLRRGNLAARFRSLVLFDQSAKLNALPLGTGNKSERLLGYYTWHADDSPPINPLGDLFKTQVWTLAKHLGVPDVVVKKPASADLVAGVNDEDELGISYEEADPILYRFLEGYKPDHLKNQGFNSVQVDLVWTHLSKSHWKRELPTVAMMSSSAIGDFYLRPKDY